MRASLAGLLLTLTGLAACGAPAAEGFLVPPRPAGPPGAALTAEELAAAGIHPATPAARPPEVAEIEIDGERRPAMLTSTAGWSWRGRVPAGAALTVGVQAVPAAWRRIDGFAAAIAVRRGGEREVLEAASAAPGGEGGGQRWIDLGVDLGRFAGREVTLEFTARAPGVPAEHRDANLVAWAPAALTRRGGPARRAAADAALARRWAGRPNILVVVIDTLRADHLTPYGYGRETSPEIARRLAAPGTVVEEAYAQAPWTLPSAASYLTGRHPGELAGGGATAYGIPAGVPTLPERLRALGYRTAGLFANPTLHAGNGFARGFETFYTPPPVVESLQLHAASLNARALPWLAAYQREPFFLYLHYLDPHDPYVNADLVDGRSPFFPDYRGELTGDSVHGVYLGQVALADPERDVAHLTALYDSEIVHVDRHLGELLGALDPAVLAETLVVLTSDHGEELHDHGGWKHGETLYQELVRVPLLFRWDGRIPAGGRLAGTVRLLDLAPTLLAAAGGAAGNAEGWDGVDLLPALTGAAPPPRRPAFAEGLSAGPLRAAAVLDGWKLVLFDRAAPFAPADEVQAYVWRRDLGRLAREELYHLAVDPGERRNLLAEGAVTSEAGAALAAAGRLGAVIVRRLEPRLPGLRVMAGDLAPGSALAASIVFAAPPAGWSSYFLGPGDRAAQRGRRLDLVLAGERAGDEVKGVRVRGDFDGGAAIEAIAVTLDGRPLPAGRVALGPGRPWGGGPVTVAELVAAEPPVPVAGEGAAAGAGAGDPPGDLPALALWLPAAAPAAALAPADDETRRRLRALGYVQ